MKLELFNYSLPESFIAQSPVSPRDSSKLMVLNGKKIIHKHFKDIVDYLDKGDVLVINETKVKPAKLIGRKSTGAKAEIIILGKENNLYTCRIKSNKPKVGNKLIFKDNEAEIIEKDNDIFKIRFKNSSLTNLAIPLPPYIKKEVKDISKYQTVYSKTLGSLAAPTAGLHFTPELLDRIQKKGVRIARVCLHVGFGTFIPVRSENIEDHSMESEVFEISKHSADLINNRKGKLIIAGTTSLRSVESAADKDGIIKSMKASTDLFVYSGYKFKVKIDALITNFHLPKSTLLMLVSALVGREKILNAYEVAKEQNYRFFSFGDAMLLFRENSQPQ